MKTKIEIIDETVEYYLTHQRAVNEKNGCDYINEKTGCMCAVGRCMIAPKPNWAGWVGELVGSLPDVNEVDELLRPEYRGHGVAFWSAMQELHDRDWFWVKTEGGQRLSDDGLSMTNNLREKFANAN